MAVIEDVQQIVTFGGGGEVSFASPQSSSTRTSLRASFFMTFG